MNGEVVGWAMRQRTGSPAAKLVLVKLADNANESGFCWPSIGLIVDHTELGQSTVYKHLDHLEAIGLAEPRQHLIGHDQSGNAIYVKAYQLAVPSPAPIPTGGKASPPGEKASPRGGRTVPPARTHKEEPSIEPSLNLEPFDAALKPRLERLATVIGNAHFQTWFGDAEFIDGTPFKIVVSKEFKRNRIIERYLSKLIELFGQNVLVLLGKDANA